MLSLVLLINWGLRNYGEEGQLGLEPTPEEYVQNMVEVFQGVWRVLRDDGTVWLNLGDGYFTKPKSNYDGVAPGLQSKNYGTGDTMLGYKEQADKFKSLMKSGYKNKDLVGIPWVTAFALREDGWYLRSGFPWLKGSAMPESVTDRPSSAIEYFFLLTKNKKYYYDADAIRKSIKEGSKRRAMRGNTEKNKYAADNHLPQGVHANTMSQPREHAGYKKMDELISSGNTPLNPAGRNRRNSDWFMDSIQDILDGQNGTLLHDENDVPIAIFCNPQPYKGAHFATFSPKLITPMIQASTSEYGACEICGSPWERVAEQERIPIQKTNTPNPAWEKAGGRKYGTRSIIESTTTGWQQTCSCDNEGKARCKVLDPFAGSGTALWVAENHGRDSIGIELSPEYVKLIENRMSNFQMNIFNI